MRPILLLIFSAIALSAQCPTGPAFPTSVPTDAVLTIAKNNVTTTLTVDVAVNDNALIVLSTTGWAANMMASVDNEVMFVTAVPNSNTLTVSRACDNSTAVVHLAGHKVDNRPTAYSGSTAVKNEIKAIAARLLQVAVAYASLPTCASGIEGTLRAVTNSNTNTWGAAVAGGGSNHILAYCNGSSWTVAAK